MRFLTFAFLALTQLPLAFAATDYRSIMRIDDAQTLTKGSESIVIAVLSTGINYELQEFRGRILPNSDGSYGYDATTGANEGMDHNEAGIGTGEASIIAGNSLGIAPLSKLLAVRVFSPEGATTEKVIAAGIHHALERGAKIIQFAGGPLAGSSSDLCEAFQAIDARGALLVVPAGNGSRQLEKYPSHCALKNMIVAAGSDEKGNLSGYSNYGFPAVHVAAPSEKIESLGRTNQLSEVTGTTFASAMTAGVAALVWSAHPEYTAQQVRRALVRGSTPTPGLSGKVLANGVLDAVAALYADVSRLE